MQKQWNRKNRMKVRHLAAYRPLCLAVVSLRCDFQVHSMIATACAFMKWQPSKPPKLPGLATRPRPCHDSHRKLLPAAIAPLPPINMIVHLPRSVVLPSLRPRFPGHSALLKQPTRLYAAICVEEGHQPSHSNCCGLALVQQCRSP